MSREFRLGLFMVVTLSILATAVFLIGDRRDMFRTTYQVNTNFPSVGGLIEGSPVRVAGVREGTVKRIILPKQPNDKVTVALDLHKETRDVVKKDSVASI